MKEKGKKVLELKNLVEQQQTRERYEFGCALERGTWQQVRWSRKHQWYCSSWGWRERRAVPALWVLKSQAVRAPGGDRWTCSPLSLNYRVFFPRDHKQQGKEKTPQPQLASTVFTGKNIKVGS